MRESIIAKLDQRINTLELLLTSMLQRTSGSVLGDDQVPMSGNDDSMQLQTALHAQSPSHSRGSLLLKLLGLHSQHRGTPVSLLYAGAWF